MLSRARRWLSVGMLLALVTVLVPNAGHTEADSALLKVEHTHAVDRPRDVIWMLTLGSDARPGEPVTRSRADSIHLIGVNAKTGHGVIVGLPRDSYVDIPGHGRDKINASMVYGGPELTARTVESIAHVPIDYVFTTDFSGFAGLIHSVRHVRVDPPQPMSGVGRSFAGQEQWMDGGQALSFSRIRYGLPGGDFDRSLNQGRVIKAGLARARQLRGQAGRFEQMMLSAMSRMDTNLSPTEMYRLGRVMLTVKPGLVRNCVVPGGTGTAGGASVVFPDLGALAGVMKHVRRDATLHGAC